MPVVTSKILISYGIGAIVGFDRLIAGETNIDKKRRVTKLAPQEFGLDKRSFISAGYSSLTRSARNKDKGHR